MLSLFLLAGCAGLSGETPPGKVEGHFFDVETNYVEKVTWTTNTVDVTNSVIVVATNGVTQTNYVVVAAGTPTAQTNLQPVYTLTPNQSTQDNAQALGSVVNAFAPGAGGLVTGILLTGFGLWGKLRSYKKSGTVLAGNIEALREFVKTLPNGQTYDAALMAWMVKNQSKLGAISQIAALVKGNVNNDDAKRSAAEIKALLDSLLKT
jgi:hypothetical protein